MAEQVLDAVRDGTLWILPHDDLKPMVTARAETHRHRDQPRRAGPGLMPAFDLSGRRALVTGGGQGVGEGIVRALADHGATVVVNDLHADRAPAVADSVPGRRRRRRST